MESYLVDVTNEAQLAEVEAAYMALFDPVLLCAADFTGPSMAAIRNGKYQPIVCKDGGDVLGVMVIKNETNGIYYPVMKGDKAAVLASMCELAQDTYDSLIAVTDNQYIHELAQRGGRPFESDGTTLTWSR